MKSKMIFGQPKHGAVLNDLPLRVAQTGIQRLANSALRRVARDDAVDELQRIFAPNLVLEQWRHINQGSTTPNGMIFVIMENVVRARDEITGPCAPVLAK